jgi:hypothetical protein
MEARERVVYVATLAREEHGGFVICVVVICPRASQKSQIGRAAQLERVMALGKQPLI